MEKHVVSGLSRTRNGVGRTLTRLVVFDVAGTTVLDDDIVIDAMSDAFAHHGLAVDPEGIRARMGLPKPVAIWELLLENPAIARDELDGRAAYVHQTFVDLALARYRDHPGLCEAPGARELFSALRDRRVTVALDTGFNRKILNVLLARLGWSRDALIDHSVASDEVPHGRPAPDLIRQAMRLADVSDPIEVVKVGDTPADIASGRAAGCGLVAAVSYGTHSRQELQALGPDVILDSLLELLDVLDPVRA